MCSAHTVRRSKAAHGSHFSNFRFRPIAALGLEWQRTPIRLREAVKPVGTKEQMAEKGSGSSSTDRFTAIHFWLCLLCFLLVAFSYELERIFNLWLPIVPLLLLPLGLLLLTLTSSIIWNAMRGRWRRAVSAAIAPLTAVAPMVVCYQFGITPTWLRFQLSRTYFEREVALAAATNDAPRLRAFAWGETGGAAVANIFHTLVFDESDEISLPPERRSASWVERAQHQPQLYSILREQGAPTIQPMSRHWYVVTQLYQ